MDYIAYLHKDRKSDFGVSFPDFPGCITAGRTLEEARRRAVEVLSFHIAGMIEDGDRIPNPSTVDDVAGDPALKNAVAFLVPAHSERTIRLNITAQESQIEKIDRLARMAGLTRSAFLVQSAIRGGAVARDKIGKLNSQRTKVEDRAAKLIAKERSRGRVPRLLQRAAFHRNRSTKSAASPRKRSSD
ncbi:MAG TPA: type II toxin-antitoxin system HicB family antitoxin [Candidatus Dormibacteraeota bacterium]|nr:type II toxin-antitoxin system HicB family antitoxin [Candidatus Dormibacteraeota bacterium]